MLHIGELSQNTKSIEMDSSLKEVSSYLVTLEILSAFGSQISQCSMVVGKFWVKGRADTGIN